MISKILGILYYKPKMFIKNIITYRRFLWEDRWWHRYWIFYMLREKLKNDLKSYKKYTFNAYPTAIFNSMGLCIKLLNRIIDDNYLENSLYFYNKEYPDWGDNGVESIPDKTWFRRCGERSDLQKKQDIEYLFKIMNKNIQNWWD